MVFRPNYTVVMHVILALRMKPFALNNWRQIPKVGRHNGEIGVPTSNLWGWIHTFSTPHSKLKSNASQALQHERIQDTMGNNNRYRVA